MYADQVEAAFVSDKRSPHVAPKEVIVVDRRSFLSGAALMSGGAVPVAMPPGASPGGADENSGTLTDILKEVRSLREASTSPGGDVAAVREQQHIYLKSTGRYPDYIDVGIGVWERVYDWHVRWQQPITITRMPDGGYGMAFTFTTLILRPNMQSNYVGPGNDGR